MHLHLNVAWFFDWMPSSHKHVHVGIWLVVLRTPCLRTFHSRYFLYRELVGLGEPRLHQSQIICVYLFVFACFVSSSAETLG